jgi:hypothetical protein
LYVDGKALANIPMAEDIVKSAGFEVRKRGGRVTELFKVIKGETMNSVVLQRKAEKGSAYYFEMCTDMSLEQNWKKAATATYCKVTIENLTPNMRYWFRVCTIKGTTVSEWSDPITIFIEPAV